MKLTEEKELKKITNEFDEAMKSFTKKDFNKSNSLFSAIIDGYKDSEYYSVLEIQTRSKVYKNIVDAQLNPVKITFDEDEDYIFEAILALNAGDLEKSFEYLNELKKKNYKNPYLFYLLSLVSVKKEDIEGALKYLKMCVEKDEAYKVIAHNEPDFDTLFENEEFKSIIEC